jgi:hypothetical protein
MRPLVLLGVLLYVVVSACGSAEPTAVDLTVAHDAIPAVSDIDVTIAGQTRSMVIHDTIRLVLPDAWADRSLLIEVDGRRGEVILAHGSAPVTPRLGEIVPVMVTLRAVPCDALCAAGEQACLDGGVVSCELRQVDGCLAWGPPVPCPEDQPSCSSGVCAVSCVDECASGERECVGHGAVRTCGQADDDSCTDWQDRVDCAPGTACTDGVCQATCTDACQLGDSQCAGAAATMTCGRDDDGCTAWQAAVDCGAGTACVDGSCVLTCHDDCSAGAMRCVGRDRLQICADHDGDGCQDWGVDLPCGHHMRCEGDGQCEPG